mgnify:CR=1 FL=1
MQNIFLYLPRAVLSFRHTKPSFNCNLLRIFQSQNRHGKHSSSSFFLFILFLLKRLVYDEKAQQHFAANGDEQKIYENSFPFILSRFIIHYNLFYISKKKILQSVILIASCLCVFVFVDYAHS